MSSKAITSSLTQHAEIMRLWLETDTRGPFQAREHAKYVLSGFISQMRSQLFSGEAIAGLVKVDIDCDGIMRKVKIDLSGKEENVELIEQAVVAAYKDAVAKRDEKMHSLAKEVDTALYAVLKG